MKKTIKEDNQRKVIKQEYLNENSLFEISNVENAVVFSIRFIESSAIREHTLLVLSPEKYLQEGDSRILISEDGEKMAIFTPVGERFQLDRLYDLKEHEFSVCDFMDIEYKAHFKVPVLDKHISYKKEKKNV